MKSNNPTSSAAELFAARQRRAQEMSNQLNRECEEIDRSQGNRDKEFESEIFRIRTAWSDLSRSRSDEEGKCKLLADTRTRLSRIREEIEQIQDENEKLTKRLHILDSNTAAFPQLLRQSDKEITFSRKQEIDEQNKNG